MLPHQQQHQQQQQQLQQLLSVAISELEAVSTERLLLLCSDLEEVEFRYNNKLISFSESV